MKNRHVYVVFSSTPYNMGKAIRKITREDYNHASIALDENLTRMYSFARRYCETPLYGGFVEETPSRYDVHGSNATVHVCRLEVTQAQYEALETRLAQMYQDKEHYLYNHLSALAVPIRKSIKLHDAYTCVEFCVEVLSQLGMDVDPKKYYSVGDLMVLLAPYTVYTGPLPQDGNYDAAYHAQKPIPHPILTTLKNILALVPRLRTK